MAVFPSDSVTDISSTERYSNSKGFPVTSYVTVPVTPVTGRSLSEAVDELSRTVVARLEAAGRTLLALPMSGHRLGVRSGGLEFMREAIEAYGWSGVTVRPAAPSAKAITQMDEALSWLSLIPGDQLVVRRVVGCRALVHPVTGRHLHSWRALGAVLGVNHHQARRWHERGIHAIVEVLAEGRDRAGGQ